MSITEASNLGDSNTTNISNLLKDVNSCPQTFVKLIKSIKESKTEILKENSDNFEKNLKTDFGLNEDQKEITLNSEIKGNTLFPKDFSKTNQIVNFSKYTFPKLNFALKRINRPLTAPARPLQELEMFKQSNEFYALENSVKLSEELIKFQTNNHFDLISSEGKNICTEFLKQLEQLCIQFKVYYTSREYRN